MTNRLNSSRPTKAALAVAADTEQEVTDCFRKVPWPAAHGLSFGLASSAREPNPSTQKHGFCSQEERHGKRPWGELLGRHGISRGPLTQVKVLLATAALDGHAGIGDANALLPFGFEPILIFARILCPSCCADDRDQPKANGGPELPRPLLKYARQASLVEQPTLPGLGLQYCCSSCA